MTACEYLRACVAELERAEGKFPAFSSSLEGLGVIWEEVEEWWDEVKRKERRDILLLEELVQVGAMLFRMGKDCCFDSPQDVEGRVHMVLFSRCEQPSWHALYGFLVRAVLLTQELQVVRVLAVIAATVDEVTEGGGRKAEGGGMKEKGGGMKGEGETYPGENEAGFQGKD